MVARQDRGREDTRGVLPSTLRIFRAENEADGHFLHTVNMEFTEEQINRYSRHILLPEVGGKGQKKIAKSRILLVGAGGLGSPAALYLAAAGVGTIGLIDSDVVDLTNLQRQILHHTPDVGRPKVLSGKEKSRR